MQFVLIPVFSSQCKVQSRRLTVEIVRYCVLRSAVITDWKIGPEMSQQY